MVKDIPGTTEKSVRKDDLVWAVLNTIDNRLDDVAGIRPLTAIGRALTTLAPANVVKSVTGIEKPSEIAEELQDSVEGELIGAGKGLGLAGPLRKLGRLGR